MESGSEEVWMGGINVWIIGVGMLFKFRILNVIIKGLYINRRKDFIVVYFWRREFFILV